MSKDAIKPVAIVGHPVLRQKAEAVELTDEVLDLCDTMLNMMYEFDGIGLAGPQVAESKRVVVLDLQIKFSDEQFAQLSEGEKKLIPLMPIALINPEVSVLPSEKTTADEGCLSIPDIYGPVTRSEKCLLKSTVISFETGDDIDVEIECSGLLSRCLQHEIDHLDGLLFIDRMALPDKVKLNSKITKLKRKYKKTGYLKSK